MLLSLLLSWSMATPLAAQGPEAPGPYVAGTRIVNFSDANYGAGNVRAYIHYPAQAAGFDTAPDLSGAPYQSVALMHGFLGSASSLQDLANHLVSHGYLVVNLDTEGGLFPNIPAYARDARAGLQWMEDESANPASFLNGMAMVGEWAAIGHSMGGGTLSHLIGIEPRVQTIIGMQAADSDAPGPANMRAYQGAGLWIAGTADFIVPPGTVKRWYNRAEPAERRFYVNVQGMGHTGCLDDPPRNEPMPGWQQHAIHRRMLVAFLDAQLRDDEASYEYLVGGVGSGAPWTLEQNSLDPILWGGEQISAGSGVFGVHGVPGAQVVFAYSQGLGSTTTPFGDLDLDASQGGRLPNLTLPASGYGIGAFAFPPTWTGTTVYFQSVVYSGPTTGAVTGLLTIDVP